MADEPDEDEMILFEPDWLLALALEVALGRDTELVWEPE